MIDRDQLTEALAWYDALDPPLYVGRPADEAIPLFVKAARLLLDFPTDEMRTAFGRATPSVLDYEVEAGLEAVRRVMYGETP